jgi:protein associated with RNAse G/E
METKDKLITINSRKFDGSIKKSWNVELINRDNCLFTFVGEFKDEVIHSQIGVIRRGTVSYEFYWLNRWYNVFRFHEPDGNLRNFYCNINLPFKFAGNVLDYVDLDIDILVWKDFSYQILDSDEFLENAERFSYSDEMRKKVRAARDELISLIETRTFPFDYKFCT